MESLGKHARQHRFGENSAKAVWKPPGIRMDRDTGSLGIFCVQKLQVRIGH